MNSYFDAFLFSSNVTTTSLDYWIIHITMNTHPSSLLAGTCWLMPRPPLSTMGSNVSQQHPTVTGQHDTAAPSSTSRSIINAPGEDHGGAKSGQPTTSWKWKAEGKNRQPHTSCGCQQKEYTNHPGLEHNMALKRWDGVAPPPPTSHWGRESTWGGSRKLWGINELSYNQPSEKATETSA